MKKQAYQKPCIKIVLIQQQHQLLFSSPPDTASTNLDEEDELFLDDNPSSSLAR